MSRKVSISAPAGWRQRERRVAGVAGAIVLLPFALFVVIPVGWVVALSFTRYDGVSSPSWVGISNFIALLNDTQWWKSVANTFVLAAGSIVIAIPLALLLAVLLNQGLRFLSGFRAVFFLPHVLSLAVMGVVFYFLFRPVDGVINGLLNGLGLLHTDVDWLGNQTTAMAALIAVSVWSIFGINTVFFLVGLQTVPREVLESASLDGAGAWRKFRSITLPLMTPLLRIVVMLAIVLSLRSFDLVKTLTDGGPAGQTDVMFTYIFQYYFSLSRGPQYGYASAASVIASLIIAAVSIVYLYFSRRPDHTQDRRGA